MPPLQDGVGTKFLGLKSGFKGRPRIETILIPSRGDESGFPWSIQGVIRPAESAPTHSASRGKEARARLKSRIYSAAAANAGFAFADDTMKSEMRGTISDLKRDPLNTP